MRITELIGDSMLITGQIVVCAVFSPLIILTSPVLVYKHYADKKRIKQENETRKKRLER